MIQIKCFFVFCFLILFNSCESERSACDCHKTVDEIIKKWEPLLLVVEDVYVLDKFPKAAIQLGEVIGVVLLAAQNNGVETLRIRPTEIKACLTGNGRSSKINVSDAVK